MGLLDTILGRTKPKQSNLDALFSLPSAAITLEAATDLVPTGTGSVCFRATEGRAFSDVEHDVCELLDSTAQGAPPVEVTQDSYGYTWLVVRRPSDQMADLVTDVHAVNSSLESAGFGPQLLCSLFAFRNAKSKLGIVYLYKQGTFYPFAPTGPQGRDNGLEIRVKTALEGDLKIEQTLTRWLGLWGAPGL